MISSIWHAAVYDPLYNGLIFLVDIIPTHDVGVAVILLTIIVRIFLIPLSRRAVESQLAMKKIQPEIDELKKKYPKNSVEQSQAIFALYKERGVRPFASIGLLLVQLPILIGLYLVFAHGGLPEVDANLLYSFVPTPTEVNMFFLGFVDMTAKYNIVLAVLAGATQFVYTRLSMGPRGQQSAGEATLSGDMAKSFDIQARYVFPVMIAGISFTITNAAPLYWVVSNAFMIVQEYAMGRRFTSTDETTGSKSDSSTTTNSV